IQLHQLPPLRLGPLRMSAGADQLPLLPPEPTWKVLDQHARGTAFIAITPRSVLNSPATTGMDFWSVNPYIGCECGCTYCYAREPHRHAAEREARRLAEDSPARPANAGPLLEPLPPWLAFERQILVKEGAAERLTRTLDPSRVGRHTIMIGTATDPYQPAE